MLGKSNCSHDTTLETYVTHSLRGEGFDASEDGTGRGTPLVPVTYRDAMGLEHWPISIQAGAIKENPDIGPDGAGIRTDGVAYTLEARAEVQAVAFSAKDYGADATEGLSPTLRAGGFDTSHANSGNWMGVASFSVSQNSNGFAWEGSAAATLQCRAQGPNSNQFDGIRIGMQVRRLTPRECERLQGFEDDYTLTPYGRPSKAKLDADFIKYQLRGNPKHLTREDVTRLAADGPRYKSLGNSMCVYNMRWIGRRIDQVDRLLKSLKEAA